MALKLNAEEKRMLEAAMATEIARVKRAGMSNCSPAIKEILGKELQNLRVLEGRISQEVVV